MNRISFLQPDETCICLQNEETIHVDEIDQGQYFPVKVALGGLVYINDYNEYIIIYPDGSNEKIPDETLFFEGNQSFSTGDFRIGIDNQNFNISQLDPVSYTHL